MAYGPPPMFDPTNVMGRRIAAWIIDLIPALVIGFVVVGHGLTRVDGAQANYCDLYRSVHGSSALCIQSGSSAYYSTSGIRGTGFLLSLLYWFALAGVLQGLTGATLGKHILGLRVVDQNGQVAGLGKALLRTFVGVFEIGLCFPIALITALVTHPHRRVGDFAAGTFVVATSSVGTPIGAAPGGSPYPPAWTPPPQTWGPPPAGSQPWGSPAPGWGAPPASAPAQTWGTPAAGPPVTPPPAQAPTTWGAPVPDEPSASQPAPQPVQQPAQQPPAQAASGREPQWDAQRNAWVFWEVETSRWLQHDPATGQWGPLQQ
jgi:RDD family